MNSYGSEENRLMGKPVLVTAVWEVITPCFDRDPFLLPVLSLEQEVKSDLPDRTQVNQKEMKDFVGVLK